MSLTLAMLDVFEFNTRSLYTFAIYTDVTEFTRPSVEASP